MVRKRATRKKKAQSRGKTGDEGLNLKKAIRRPGRMKAWCARNGYAAVTCACLKKALATAKRRGDTSLRGAALLGMRFKKCGGYKLDKKG